jgi:3-methylcrotonyl-CoA carboxylase alpha subunit
MAPLIRRVLIANRGEIAVRVARAARTLGITPLGIASEADRAALHRSAMEESLIIGPARANESYLNFERVLEAALSLRADALHPGYGFLSERADFAQAVIEAGLIWIGPTPHTLALAGDKREARRIAHTLGIPTLAGYDGEDISDAELAEHARTLGFPLLIKATNGGGGRGQRMVAAPEEFTEALAQARREAKAAFGDESVLLERCLRQPRHIETQILADAHGTILCLGERDCSLQRRRQKVIEEAPAPNLDRATSAEMAEAAIRLARATEYRNAGTVEFLLEGERRWYFLEINARLQVEHPVTEWVHSIDLVATQFRIANGEALDLAAPPARGWAVEARICAEDPAHDLLPSSGTISRVDFPAGESLRVDSGIGGGSVVPIEYDSLLAKLSVWGETREAAFERLAQALAETTIEGIPTNLPTLRLILDDARVRAGQTHTTYLDESGLLRPPATEPSHEGLHQAAEALLASRDHARVASVGIPLFFTLAARRYALEATRFDAEWECTPLHLPTISVEHFPTFRCPAREGEGAHAVLELALASPLEWLETGERSSPRAGAASGLVTTPMPGRILRLAVREGTIVGERDVIAVLEAMKMEHRIEAGRAGWVTRLKVREGDVVAAGAVICEIAEAATNP